MISTIESIRREIVVPVSAERAFEVFTAGMTGWWPSDHHIGDAPIAEVVIEPREGGRWYTRHEDGSETSTGYVDTWDPPQRLVLTWQIGADWKYDPSLITTVELRFVAEGPGRTRVALEHRDLDRYGPEAERMRETFEQPGAWDGTLAAFAGAFGAGA
jgi:uncharacterized protein YndB with AHSA1/START domain